MPAGVHEAGVHATNGSASQRRTALVTGGTDGIGKEIARELALESMCVVVVGSNVEKGMRAERDLREATRNDDVYFIRADLGLMRDVDRFARQVAARWPKLHRLVLCAGIVRGRYSLTSEAIETNFAINYLGRFALTEALLPCLVAGGQVDDSARIVVIGGAAQNGRVHYDDINLKG
jgi:NAD(P)-dependent dehydrogenase (short-subunit alcohol dehydrogenase family)